VIIYCRNWFRKHIIKNIIIIKCTNWFIKDILKNANTILFIIAKKLNQNIKKINNNKFLFDITWAIELKNNKKKSNNNLNFKTSFIKLNDLNNATYAIAIASNNRNRNRINTLKEFQVCFFANFSLTFLIDKSQDYVNNNARKHWNSNYSQIKLILLTYSQDLNYS